MPDNTIPAQNPLLVNRPKAELTKVQKIANEVTSASAQRRDNVKLKQAASSQVINASMYDKKIEKLQSYGSKWNDYGYQANTNNEAFYDKITTDSEQWGRSIKGAAKLASIGFNDSALFGKFANSKKNADEFGKVADIYSTQRGGITGFAQNLTMNAGYTLGITMDMVAEELAIMGISALTALPSGGGSLAVGGAAMVGRGVKAFGQIGKAFDKMNDIKRAINAADKVKDVSKAAAFGKKALNALNPIENTTKYIQSLKNVSTVKDLTVLGKIGQGGAAVFRDVKAGQMAISEARLEANMLEKDMYDDYLSKNPNMTEEEGRDLTKRINNAKAYTLMENTGAIFATNKLVFNNMYKRFDDMKGVGKFISTGKFGNLATAADGTTRVIRSGNIFQKGFYQGIKDQGKLLFEKGIGSGLGKIGKTAIAKTGTYGVSNLGEGLQETIQETIQAKNKYQFGSKASGGYFNSLVHGLKEQATGQGLETFASGFLMGGLVSPVTSTMTAPLTTIQSGSYKQFTNKKAFNTEREKKLNELQEDADLISEGYKNVGAVYNSMGNNLATQAKLENEMVQAAAEGDRHTFQDKKDESYRAHLQTMMKHDMLDDFIKHTEGFKSMDTKQAAAAFGINENSSQDVINKLINKKVQEAKKFKTKYTTFKNDYQSPVDISKLKKDDVNYNEMMNYHYSWNKAVDDLIFDTAEFEQNLDRKKDLLNVIQTDAQAYGVSFNDYNALTSNKEMNKEIGMLTQEVAVLNGYENLTPEAKKDLIQKNQKLKALIQYQESLGDHDRVIAKIDELQSKPNTSKAEKVLLKKLNKRVKQAADTMELRHGKYLEIVHSKDYDPNNVTVNEGSRNSRINRFSKNSFSKLYDYYKLDNRNARLEENIDILSDENYFNAHVDRMSKMSDMIIEQHKNYVKNSIAKFRDQEEVNKVVKELLDAGVSFDLSEMDELIEKGIMPKELYDITTEEVLKQSDPKYKMALKKLNDLVDNLIDQPILEKENDIYREVGRGVRINEGDKRTYNEIAKEYGFDVANEQKVSDVLDTIIASKSSTKAEKDLAKILKRLVDENAKVSFVDNSSRPNKFKGGVSIIDGRYAASNFTNSVFSIEELILKNELERLTTDALKNDPVFNAEVKSLKEATMAYIKSENEKNKDKPSEQIKDNWKAFDSELDFIKESFGNQTFQTLLARVKAPKKESTIWTDLIDALSNLLGRTVDVSNSVYNSIVSVVQAKIDPSQLNTPQQDDSLVEEEDTPEVTPETTPEEIAVEPLPAEDLESFDPNAEIASYPKALLNQLIDGYKQAIKDGDVIADAKINELSDTNITPKFKSWVDDYGTEIIDAYDALVNEPMQTNSEVLDDETKANLAGKGYTSDEVDAMTPGQVEQALTDEVLTSPEVTLEEQVIDELIDENIIIESDEETSEETIPVDTTGEGTSDTVSSETNQKENPKQPKSIGANTDVVVVDDQSERPDIFDEWVNQEISGSDGNKLAISKEIQDLYEFGQSLDANNSEWTIGSFRTQVAGRLIVDVFADGKRFLVYKSTGLGTGAASKGEWTPLFSFAKDGWFVKTNWKGENPKFNKYESTTFKNIDAYLKTAEDSLFSGAQTKPVETVEPVSQPQETTSQAEEFLRTDEEALKKLYFQDSFRTGIHSPKAFLEKLAKEELEKEATANKKLFRKAKAPTKEEISKRAFEMFLDRVKNTKQDNSVFEWRAYDGQGGFGIKYSSDNKTNDMSTVDIRNQKKLHNYTYDETFNSNGVRYVDVKIPIQKSDSTGSNRPSVYTAIVIALPDGMSASEVAEPLIEKAKQLSENRSSINNPTTTKEMVDTLIPIAESIIKNTKPDVSEKTETEKKVDIINKAFEDLAKSAGEAAAKKMQQYADRIKAGEPKEKVLEGLGKSFIDGVNALLAEPVSSEQPVGRNQSMHEKLVDKLTSGKSIKAKLTGKTPNSPTGFVMEVDGEKVIIFDHNTAIKAEDFGKPVTLKLIPVLKRPGREDLNNVIQVYSGDRFLGNVAITDYDTTAKETLSKDSTEEEIINAAADVVDNNEPIFATQDSKLKELGYTPTDIKRLSKAVKMHIVKNEITKAQYVAEQKALKKLDVENQVQSGITDFLKNRFTGIKTEAGLVDVYEELVKYATTKLGVTLNEINDIHLPFIQNIFNQAKIDLANQKDFSTLSVGDKLLLTDGRIVKVSKVNTISPSSKIGSIEVVDFNSIIENKVELNSKQFNTDVKKVINDFNLKQDEIVSALDQNNLDDLSSILSKFTTQSFAIADEEVTDEDILEHFKACK